ncbi:hypothetical protein SAMN05216517_108103 [Janthinobacterium sp. OK676]|nr:hypothetical protein CLU90_5034 [Janthinobacterium sp. 67]SDN10849.1 hypothetical protein SAMN05216517_108103 [Janthinobacterium sp. OK676]
MGSNIFFIDASKDNISFIEKAIVFLDRNQFLTFISTTQSTLMPFYFNS